MLEGTRQCTILCLNVHTTVEYRNTNVSTGHLLQHISKSIVDCALPRPKMLTKTYNKEIRQASQPLPFIDYDVKIRLLVLFKGERVTVVKLTINGLNGVDVIFM